MCTHKHILTYTHKSSISTYQFSRNQIHAASEHPLRLISLLLPFTSHAFCFYHHRIRTQRQSDGIKIRLTYTYTFSYHLHYHAHKYIHALNICLYRRLELHSLLPISLLLLFIPHTFFLDQGTRSEGQSDNGKRPGKRVDNSAAYRQQERFSCLPTTYHVSVWLPVFFLYV